MKITRVFIIAAATCLIVNASNSLNAQTVEDIITDRPDQTESAATVPRKHWQFEMGGTFEGDKISTSEKTETMTVPSLLIRYGLSKNVELRLGSEYSQEKIKVSGIGETKNTGLSPIYLGTKIGLLKERKYIPQTALITAITIPYEKDNKFQPEKIGAEIRFTMKHSLSDKLSLSYNIGGEWDGDEEEMIGLYTLTLGISLADKLGMYVESYGYYKNETSADNRLDGGFTYLLKPNIQLDASGGYGINEISPDYFAGLGISFRLPN